MSGRLLAVPGSPGASDPPSARSLPPTADAALIGSVTQDSRSARPGSLFVPLAAERDGHDFIPEAVQAGACAYLVAQTATEAQRRAAAEAGAAAAIEVVDPLTALTALARTARRRIGAVPVIGVTGSVGKTTTKDLIAAVLGRAMRVHASSRSFNNEIGVPLTLLAAPDESEGVDAVVIEMGARGKGHIRSLCELAEPTFGVVTAVGLAHTSGLGSLRAVAAAKRELVECLPAEHLGGVAFLNADMPEVAGMSAHTPARVVAYGTAEEADVTARSITLNKRLRPRFVLSSRLSAGQPLEGGAAGWMGGAEAARTGREAPGGGIESEEVEVVLAARGWHAVGNALAAAAVGLTLGVSFQDIAAGLSEAALSPLRMELVRTPGGALVLNDSYNANPLSVRAALLSLAALPGERRIAVLGVMAELGEHSAEEHAGVTETAVGMGVHVIAVDAPEYGVERDEADPGGRPHDTVSEPGSTVHVSDLDGALEALESLGGLDADAAVLVKGSRVAGLERLVDRLLSGASSRSRRSAASIPQTGD